MDVNNNGVADGEDYEAALGPEDEESWDEVSAMFGDENGDRVIEQEEYESLAGSYEEAMDLEAEYEEWNHANAQRSFNARFHSLGCEQRSAGHVLGPYQNVV